MSRYLWVIPLIAFLLVAALIWSLFSVIEAQTEARLEVHYHYFSQCEYLGSRYQRGFGGGSIYRYDCGGVVEETYRRWQ